MIALLIAVGYVVVAVGVALIIGRGIRLGEQSPRTVVDRPSIPLSWGEEDRFRAIALAERRRPMPGVEFVDVREGRPS